MHVSKYLNGRPNNDIYILMKDLETSCQSFKARIINFTSTSVNMHIDKMRDKCEFWWQDYNECMFQRKLVSIYFPCKYLLYL